MKAGRNKDKEEGERKEGGRERGNSRDKRQPPTWGRGTTQVQMVRGLACHDCICFTCFIYNYWNVGALSRWVCCATKAVTSEKGEAEFPIRMMPESQTRACTALELCSTAKSGSMTLWPVQKDSIQKLEMFVQICFHLL